MTKQTSPLESSREIKSTSQISLNSETVGFFTNFEAIGIEWTPKNGIFEKNLEKCQIFKEYPFKINETETGTKQIISGLKLIERDNRNMWVPP